MPNQGEQKRLDEANSGVRAWRTWGAYLSDRQWGTVREDYSPDGAAWDYLTHDMARSRAYRWGEDGLAGFSDDHQRICFCVGLWNERDPILKERLFGLSGPEGNHGEDVKELYYHLDATPTHSYLKMLYKYPQAEFPYAKLVEENRRRSRHDPEYELLDTGVFDEDRYFDVFVEYAKAGPDDILVRITAHNRGPDAAPLHVIPQVWFRNNWTWDPARPRPIVRATGERTLALSHAHFGEMSLYCDGEPRLLFCDNETNTRRVFGNADGPPFCKDAFHEAIVGGRADAVNPAGEGTKAAAHHRTVIEPGASATFRLRLASGPVMDPFKMFDSIFTRRATEADAFYKDVQAHVADADARLIQRQAFAGMVWGQQFYDYNVAKWITGDAGQPPPPKQRRRGRNSEWGHLNNADVISMPDKWEYPWYASWDLAFHCIPLAMIDPEFAKGQLVLLTREWYMHPNGQLPAYEWAFGDVNPPVHAWAAWRVYEIDRDRRSKLAGKAVEGDREFLERVFHKLLINFTWWVNRKDPQGRNVFEGGFLGLDNIGVFDRSATLPTGGNITQADGTSWMGMYCLNLMRIALELAIGDRVYQDLATKFFEHFLYIAAAMNKLGCSVDDPGVSLWDETDEFYYDVLSLPDGRSERLKIRSMVGLVPLFAVEVLSPELLKRVPEFASRLEWFLSHRPDLAALVSRFTIPGGGESRLLSLLRGHRMKRLIHRMFDATEFLSDYGVRALSKHHEKSPFTYTVNGEAFVVSYQPGESDSGVFGGNSNWRGPIWMPMNFLLVESLRKFHSYYGDDFRIECPTGSGKMTTLSGAADELSRRLMALFTQDADGKRALFNGMAKQQADPHFRNYLLFFEYFHGDSGRGVGASHQTGWTGLIATIIGATAASAPRTAAIDESERG